MELGTNIPYLHFIIKLHNEFMKIKKSILKKINSVRQRMSIADKLGVGEQALAVQLRINKSDGRLTKMDALQAISEELGIEVGDILEKETVKA